MDDFIDWASCSSFYCFVGFFVLLLFCNVVDSVLHAFFYCSEDTFFIKQFEIFFNFKNTNNWQQIQIKCL